MDVSFVNSNYKSEFVQILFGGNLDVSSTELQDFSSVIFNDVLDYDYHLDIKTFWHNYLIASLHIPTNHTFVNISGVHYIVNHNIIRNYLESNEDMLSMLQIVLKDESFLNNQLFIEKVIIH